ncbi:MULTISPECIES: acyltransferase family protein [Bacillus]|uniref:acyltransferase family protein n=1 Tax=Bacillus TaxID=1386 RepID=UPI0001A0A14D|nr:MULTISPECIES: acyltransferase [Bacillus cereus group]EEL37721.1 Acyltransferase [Bacillus cereus Rock3-29]KAB0444928.1 acyltransferase [Lysinibacillus sp. VIA-II-2016]EJV53213.1 hypothetical protein IEA_00365 [Bacillus toyonensis]EJV96717.1 hypothetical protein IGI_00293 [Bacillus toyonensis]EOP36424.1 hypothetical protein IKI_04521 [Bacillus toyonensis]
MRRIHELDSLRGIAAVTVMFSHYLLIFPAFFSNESNDIGVNVMKYTPLHIFWAGHEAVILFFILSGLVLTIPFINTEKINYGNYIFKRIFRIYIPYIFAVLIAIVSRVLFYTGPKNGLSDWFNSLWSNGFEYKLFFEHVLFIGSFNNNAYDPVLWSLIHEMRISLIFPFIIYIVKRCSVQKSLCIAMICSIMGISLTKISNSRLDIDVDYFMTLHYTAMFIVGSILAINLNGILQSKYVKKSGIYLFLGGISFYTYRWWFFPKKAVFHKEIIGDWMTVLGVVLIICCLLRDPLSSFMKYSVFQFLGKISYSLYLYHSIVMLTLIHLLYGYLNIYMILILSIVGSLLVAFLAQYFVERNSIKLGKNLSLIEYKLKYFKGS